MPTPAHGECLVEVAACALCGSDLHIMDGKIAANRPVTLGHEASGVVRDARDVGANITAGTAVFIDPILVCGHCAACRSGRSHICRQRQILGVNRDGAFAEFVVVPARNLVPLAESVSLQSAAMVESASTAFHALTKRAPSFAGEPVVVVGVGGLGFHAVAIARLLGASEVIALDVSETALTRALDHGATMAFDAADPELGKKVRTVTEGGAAVAVECVGVPAAQEAAFACLRRGGSAVLMGVGSQPLAGPTTERLVTQEIEVRGSFAYARDEIESVIRLIAAERLDVAAAISERYPLQAIEDAVASFRNRTTTPIRVLVTKDG